MKTLADINPQHLAQLLIKFGINLCPVSAEDNIPGSYWGAPEAGIIGNQLYVRPDTPIHSALHESCHYICMDESRRSTLHTDTGGDYDEENAVCFLQIVLARYIEGTDPNALCTDMDEWGYTFRLGSANKWFVEDAEDAFNWLQAAKILDSTKQPTWKIRH